MPFSYCEINDSGDATVCCNQWCNGFIYGNILEDDFLDILEGEKSKVFLNQFKTQQFKYCNFNVCPAFKKYDSEEEYNKDLEKYKKKKNRELRLSFDRNCNVNCVFCRSNFLKKDQEQIKLLVSKIEKHLPYFNENNYEISLNGVGEIFVSKILKNFIKITSTNYPNIRFHIVTNGILCTKENLDELGITDKLTSVEISLHAINEKTYNKLVLGGNLKKAKKNVLYVSELVKHGKVKDLLINFVVNSINYKEMVNFAKWCFKIGAKPNFLPLIAVENTDFKTLNIADPNHSLHSDFVRVMQNPIFRREDVLIPKHYLELKPNKKPNFLTKLFKI